MNDVGARQGKLTGRRLRGVAVVALTLGFAVSSVASPTVKRELPRRPSGSSAKHHWFQIGKASWYGPRFNGRETANGETYDMYALTCAHRTLPLGTWVRVTNLHNKKVVFLRVNDRGPMASSLIVDLSYKAAQRLGIDGLGKVKIEAVSPTDPALVEQLVAQLPVSNDPVVVTSGAPTTPTMLSLVQDR